MKRFSSTIIITALLFFASCSKSNDIILSETPTAKAVNDFSNYGYYKGICLFEGSSGIIAVNIYNDDTLSAYVRVDGVDYNFTTTQSVQGGEGATLNFVSGPNSFLFTVDGNGTRPSITNLVINGHPDAAWLIVKETSTALVKCYEGTYTGDESEIFNTLIYSDQIKGLEKRPDLFGAYEVDGTVSNNKIDASEVINPSAKFKGIVNGNNLSGTWVKTPDLEGNWSGTRTY